LRKSPKLTEPIEAQLRAVHPASLGVMDGIPGIDYEDQTVSFEAKNFQEAYDGIVALIRLASYGYTRILQRVVSREEDGSEIFEKFGEQLFADWVEVESGNWKPPTPREKAMSSQKYFGAR